MNADGQYFDDEDVDLFTGGTDPYSFLNPGVRCLTAIRRRVDLFDLVSTNNGDHAVSVQGPDDVSVDWRNIGDAYKYIFQHAPARTADQRAQESTHSSSPAVDIVEGNDRWYLFDYRASARHARASGELWSAEYLASAAKHIPASSVHAVGTAGGACLQILKQKQRGLPRAVVRIVAVAAVCMLIYGVSHLIVTASSLEHSTPDMYSSDEGSERSVGDNGGNSDNNNNNHNNNNGSDDLSESNEDTGMDAGLFGSFVKVGTTTPPDHGDEESKRGGGGGAEPGAAEPGGAEPGQLTDVWTDCVRNWIGISSSSSNSSGGSINNNNGSSLDGVGQRVWGWAVRIATPTTTRGNND
jgi:hypothetical protein